MRIDELIKEMTLEEKAAIVAGTDFMYTNPIPRLGIESIRMSDGPHGLRVQREDVDDTGNSDPATCFPTAVTLASTFNPDLAHEMGVAIGNEARHYGIDVVLGPGTNIKRNPLAGRNFEYFSEDPLLAGAMASGEVSGIESTDTAVAIKHFALNNSENYRLMGDSVADMRAIREIYLRPFEIAVKGAHPETVMCSYNKINGTYASANRWLLTDVLRREWGFDGLVMTDWGATHDRVAMLKAGLDLEMPGDNTISRKWVIDAVKDGALDESVLDQAVRNILTLVANHEGRVKENADFDLHHDLAVRIATDGAVLLKNDSALPLSKDEKYLVVGELFEKPRYQGAGSSLINPARLVTPMEAFDSHGVEYTYLKGYRENTVEVNDELIREAIKEAEKFDTVLLFVGLTDDVESEGCDREHMRLPENQLALIDAIVKKNKRVVVVSYCGSPYEASFADDVSSILNMYLPGQGSGEATYSLLFGDVSPSGRLAETWPVDYSYVPFGESFSRTPVEVYRESVFVGYRYYATKGHGARYPFGYGLSYTDFEWSDMSLEKRDDGVCVSVTVKNVGRVRGADVVQLYTSKRDSTVPRPRRELGAFKKVYLEPEEATRVELFVPIDSLKYWNIKENRLVLEDGEYILELCRDSQTPVMELTAAFEGETVCSPYTERVDRIYRSLDLEGMDDEVFEEMSSLKVPAVPPKTPITIESRFTDLTQTFIGKMIFAGIMLIPKMELRKAKRLPEGKERDNRIKGAIFKGRAMRSGSILTNSMTSSGQFPYNLAEGLVHMANGKIFKGLGCMMKKIDTPKLPKENKK
ncbi:MAG: glycoside hydrolase family 3 C-terminal domain-containing protein [Clostridia bacterium]|nr:glycoside hydrolase family 3 C-terminal domain-containing protein [Clostridia bacterium]